MSRTRKFLTLLLSTLICVLLIKSLPPIQGASNQHFTRQAVAVSRNSQSYSLISSKETQVIFEKSSAFEPTAIIDLKPLARLIQRLQKADRKGSFTLKVIFFVGTLIVQLLALILNFLIALINPITVPLILVWVCLKNFFGSKWEEIRVKISVEQHIQKQVESSKILPLTSSSETSENNDSSDSPVKKLWKKLRGRQDETTHNINTDASLEKIISFDVNDKTYIGCIKKIPRQIYKGDSCVIELDLIQKTVEERAEDSQESSSSEVENIQSFWEVEKIELKGETHSLELELSSPDFKTDQDKKQHQTLDSTNLHYYWNCKVASSGKHRLDLIFKVFDSSNPSNTKRVSRKGWDVKVVEIPGLTGDRFKAFKEIPLLLGSFYGAYVFIGPFLPPQLRIFSPTSKSVSSPSLPSATPTTTSPKINFSPIPTIPTPTTSATPSFRLHNIVCLTNNTSTAIHYYSRTNDSAWKENLLSPGFYRVHSAYLSTLDKFRVKFDQDPANTENLDIKEYSLESNVTFGKTCGLAKKYYFSKTLFGDITLRSE